ncbi:MAG: tRNA (adenosine(37)-N6)-threonylcarbamoyltransferase complex ATPase subunit type 1 TsaE [SAR324 cluster bacterium]|nr:tRNA (adenosine(37)-N6)-threonylcarbamoyltransferase complex ATPase subunit type 1 TsaE [SAR324 cluster bacterium]
MFSIDSHSLDDTRNIGKLIGKNTGPGQIILLTGDLGSGKTTLSKSICEALGVNPDSVISPTYTLVNVYEGDFLIHHVDLYRLNTPEDLDSFDREDLISEEGVTLVEWPEFFKPLLESEALIEIELQTLDENTRRLKIQNTPDSSAPIIEALRYYEHTRN